MENILFVDMGHGQFTPGKRSPWLNPEKGILYEYLFNREVGETLMVELDGIPSLSCVMTVDTIKTSDVLNRRVNFANGIIKDHPNRRYLFLSIHANAWGSGWTTANGVETFAAINSSQNSIRAAKIFQKNLVEYTGLRDRCQPLGYKTANFYVLRETICPAVLVECGFYTNIQEVEFLHSKAGKERIVSSLKESVLDYFNIKQM